MPKRGENIYKRKDGRWAGRYNYTYDNNGKRHYHSVYAHTYQEIKDKLSVMKVENKKKIASCKLTVKELFKEWLIAVKMRVKPTTYSCYNMKIIKHILPEFGSTMYSKLNVTALHKFIDDKINGGLSAKYVSDIIIVFKSMSKYISKIHNCTDPLNNVVLPKREKKVPELLNDEQQAQLKNKLETDSKHTRLAVMLSYYTGLRIGEVCGLKWEDIDFNANTLSVNRTVQRIYVDKSTRVIVGSPKSKSSVRTIPLPKVVADTLKKYRNEKSMYVLSGKEKFVEPRTLQYRFKAFLKKANLPSINFHALRHMFATNCVKLGFDVKTLSEILGHSSVEVTLRV